MKKMYGEGRDTIMAAAPVFLEKCYRSASLLEFRAYLTGRRMRIGGRPSKDLRARGGIQLSWYLRITSAAPVTRLTGFLPIFRERILDSGKGSAFSAVASPCDGKGRQEGVATVPPGGHLEKGIFCLPYL